MSLACGYCLARAAPHAKIVRHGHFYRRSDRKLIRRYRCTRCLRSFSKATSDRRVHQKKRHVNILLNELLCSGVSQRRCARILKVSRTTVVRKFLFLAREAHSRWRSSNNLAPKAKIAEFDDMETFEHTKCKPLSITLAVEHASRRILALEVSRMPAKGPLASLARKKYGPRPDERAPARRRLLERLGELSAEDVILKSDESPHYPHDVRKAFPRSLHKRYKGKRGCIVGQGELKKTGFDPLFSLNHTAAMLRADINRLIRRTWCTTKKPERLLAHLTLYANYHNEHLPKAGGP